jgi:DnaJ-class molecular chaperone
MSNLPRRSKTICPKCHGYKAIAGKSSGPYVGSPATLICPRCDGTGEVWEDSLTELEKNPPLPIRYERDDV